MKKNISDHFEETLFHLYINPIEKCNLRCKICYTKKTNAILKEEEIIKFIEKYRMIHPLDVITFCGGEVFTLSYFTGLINKLTGIIIQIITNGTVDKLEEIKNPNMINLIVSLDGLRDYHDSNRGKGNFDTSLKFLEKAISLGFHTEVFSIVTKQNYDRIDEFVDYLKKELGLAIPITFHPRKPREYLLHHPISNIEGQVKGFDYLSDKQLRHIMKNRKTFPSKELGCYQIALVSNGLIYGCCEGTAPLGKIDDKIEKLFGKLRERLELWDKENKIKGCLGCSQSEFVCGIKKFI